MRGLPDSAVVGTYKRVKRMGKPRKVRRSRQTEADIIYALFVEGIKLVKKGRK